MLHLICSVAIVLAITLWGWLWGFVGVLVAVPLLIIASVISNHVEGLGGLRELLGPHVKAPWRVAGILLKRTGQFQTLHARINQRRYIQIHTKS